jgi:hypothetical protein
MYVLLFFWLSVAGLFPIWPSQISGISPSISGDLVDFGLLGGCKYALVLNGFYALTTPRDTSRMENDSNFQKYMANYNRWDAYKHETELYKPFVELANYCLGKKSKIQFCRDDPTIVLGSDAERKPNTVNIWWAALALGSRTSVDNLSGGGPGKLDAFHWMEILAFWEFKFVPGGVSPGTRRHIYDPSRSDAVMNSQSGQLNSGAAATEEGGEEGSSSPQQSGTKTKNRCTRWPADDDEV